MKKSKILRAIRKELFKVENLESRILLSADPVLGTLHESFIPENNPQQQTLDLLRQQVFSSSAKQIPAENIALQKNTVSKSLALSVDTLASFEIQNLKSFSQTVKNTLEIQIGGTEAGKTYDQLNVSGAVNLAGTLSISQFNFQPKIGDTFDILKFDSITGSFDNAVGLYGFNSDYYFDIVQTPHSLQLVTKEFVIGDGFNLLGNDSAKNDALGQLFNYDYFSKAAKTVELDGSVNLGSSLNVSGHISFGLQNTNTNYTLSDNSKVAAETWILSARDAQGFLGLNGGELSAEAKGLLFNKVDLGLAFINPVDNADDRSWVMAKGSMGGLSFNALPELSVSASDLTLDFSEGLGVNKTKNVNQTILNLVATPIVVTDSVGELAKFNDDGKLGERLQIGGSAELKISEFNVAGNFWFSKDNQIIQAVATDVTANLTAANTTIGLEKGTLGLLISDKGTALEASGALLIESGDFASSKADAVTVRLNTSDVDYSKRAIKFAGNSYTFGDLKASKTLQEISITSLTTQIANTFTISGGISVVKNKTELQFIGKNASVMMTSGDYKIGVSETNFGLVVGEKGKALEAKGKLVAQFGDTANLSAEKVTVRWNQTGVSFTKTTLTSSENSYQFVDLPASKTLQEIKIENGNITVADSFKATGNFTFYKNQSKVQLSNGKSVDVDVLTLGGSNLEAFFGINNNEKSALGLTLGSTNLALALFSERVQIAPRKWTSLKADSEKVALIGTTDIELKAKKITVELNLEDKKTKTVVDFKTQTVKVATGLTSSLTLDFDGKIGEIIRASGSLDIAVAGYFMVKGDFAFEKSEQNLTLSDGKKVKANALIISGADASAFAGINGGTVDEMGLKLSKVDFALAMFANSATPAQHWTALKATAGTVEIVGVSDVTISAKTISVEINLQDVATKTVVDFKTQNLKIGAINFDFDGKTGEIIRAAGSLDIAVAGYFMVKGDFAFEKSTQNLTLSDGKKVKANALIIGGADASAFAGINGGNADEMGLKLSKVDFALAMFANSAAPAQHWTALKATAGTVEIVGVSDVTIAAKTISVEINLQDATTKTVVDFKAQNLKIGAINFDFDGKTGEIIRAAGSLDIAVAGYFMVKGEFAFEKSEQNLTLSDGKKVKANALIIGGADASAFAGINGGTADEMGLKLGKVDFALAMFANSATPAQHWTALKA
ncbi:MAG: LEPR-XLL domain-containing protein, partial [Methylococcaceae bacterium]